MSQTKYFDMEKISVRGFLDFCRNNIPLVIAITFMLFFTYGIRLFWYGIGIDTELFMSDRAGFLTTENQIGRFGLVFLQNLWYINEFNPLTIFFVVFFNIWFFTVSWCYIIAVFNKNTGKDNHLIPFALIFMTSPVWAEQFYFITQAAEISLMIGICPYVVYFLYRGFLNNEKNEIVSAFILLVLMISVYQSIVLLFCCGIFACFMLLQEHSAYEPRVYKILCLKIFIFLLAALAVYFAIDKIIVSYVLKIEKSDYLYKMSKWGQLSIGENIGAVLVHAYMISIGHLSAVQAITEPIMAHYARTGIQAAKNISAASYILGNLLLLPALILFLVKTSVIMRNKIPHKCRLLYMLAVIGVPLCIMILTIVVGDRSPTRSEFALPFAFAFMLLFVVKTYPKKISVVIVVLALCTAFRQAEITAQLFYSDQIRYNEDVRLASELEKMITRVQLGGKNLPVALVGRHQIVPRFKTNFIQGQVIGRSIFVAAKDPEETTRRGLAFMGSLGMHFDMPEENALDRALQEAETMPSYPDPGCVRRLEDMIVVRISETLYK